MSILKICKQAGQLGLQQQQKIGFAKYMLIEVFLFAIFE